MKLEGKNITNVVIVGQEETHVATINQNKLDKLQYLLTNGLYSDGIGSTIVEITNNALDSIIQAGKDPMQNPVYVYIERNIQTNKYQLRIVDNGLGLDEDEFKNVVMNYLTSTKEDSDDVIGAFGIGAKSWCSVSNTATFVCTKNGVERTFLCYKGATFLEHNKILEREVDAENGVTFIMPIKDYSEKWQFEAKARQKLCYYDNVILTIDEMVENNIIYRSHDFQFSTLNTNPYLHFSLKDVYYSLNFEALGIKSINVPVCLRFDLKDGIQPTPSREQIIYKEDTKELILSKITRVAQWFQQKYNESMIEVDNIWDVWKNINADTRYVNIEGKDIEITSLLNYAKLEVEPPKVKNVTLRDLKWYKKNHSEFFYGYRRVGFIGDNGNFKKKENSFPSIWKALQEDIPVILIPEAPVGVFRTFLQQKYGRRGETLFVVKERDRKLGSYKDHSGYTTYRSILSLTTLPKKDWRGFIKEFQYVEKMFTDRFDNQLTLHTSQEYLDWLDHRKQEIKKARLNSSRFGSKYVALNKQRGQEITVNTAREFKWGGKVVFNKGTAKIGDLSKRKHLTVYFTEEYAKANMSLMYKMMSAFAFKREIKFVWLNLREIKFVKDLKNWKSKDQFMFSKPLKRYITANLISNYLQLIPPNEGIIYDAFPKYGELKKRLKDYATQWTETGSNELYHELQQFAKENNVYDEEILGDLNIFKKIMDDCGFLSYLKPMDSYSYPRTPEAQKKVLRNMIYIMLKHKKVTGKAVEEFDLVPIEKPEPKEFDFWQPKLDEDGNVVGHEDVYVHSFEVWKKKENLMKDFENCEPIGYYEGQIEDVTFMDETYPDDAQEEETTEEEESTEEIYVNNGSDEEKEVIPDEEYIEVRDEEENEPDETDTDVIQDVHAQDMEVDENNFEREEMLEEFKEFQHVEEEDDDRWKTIS